MTILTQKQMHQSLADAFSRAVEHAYKDLLDAAVRAEREACAKVCDDIAKETFSAQCQVWGEHFARAIRARGNP